MDIHITSSPELPGSNENLPQRNAIKRPLPGKKTALSNRMAAAGWNKNCLLKLPGKLFRRLKRTYHNEKQWIGQLVAKAIFSLPGISRFNLRKKVVNFIDHCVKVESFPYNDSFGSKDWYLKIRSAETIRRKEPFSLHTADIERFRQSVRLYNQGEAFQLPEVFIASINQARIYSRDFLIMSGDKQRLFYESALSGDEILERNGVFNKMLWPSLKRISGEFCILACPWSDKYYEWLLGNLPRLSVIEQFDELKSIRLIVPHSLNSYQRASLLMAGIAPERLVGFDNRYWQVDRLYFPQLPGPFGNPSPQAVAWLRTRFLGPADSSPPQPKRLIYVTRRDAQQRRVLNEGEIVNYLQGIGFEIVCLSELSFAEQIKLFSDARIVIGPHGAGFSNMVFAPANATLIEFFGDNYLHGCFWALASILGQEHAFLVGPSKWLDYSISLPDLKSLLDRLLAG